MLIRLLLSVASLTVGLAGGVVVDCARPTLRALGGDPTGLCAAVAPLGIDAATWIGIGIVLFAAMALTLTWVPVVRARSRRQRQPVVSLHDNLSRLVEPEPEPEPDSSVSPSGADVLHAGRLNRRLEALEAALSVDSVATREVTEQWMRLLRETNDLHNRGELPTEDFKRLNTRLLDLFAPAGEQPRTGDDTRLTGSPRQ